MNPERLLQHFERISEAPDAIPRLRRFILDLAVRGKLVEQDPNDEPAGELLKRIEREKQNLLKSREIKKIEEFEPIQDDELPFVIPSSWQFCRMGWLAQKLGAGSTPLGGQTIYQKEGVPFLRSQNVHNDGLHLDDVAFIPKKIHEKMSGTHIQKHDILLNITGASIGRCALVSDDFIEGNVSQHVAIVRLFFSEIRGFIHLSLISPSFQNIIDDVQVGISRAGLSMQRLKLFPMPIPPLAEQHRIVAKVDELMALCDRLEAAQTEREQTRDRLVAASLQRLNQPDDAPAAFREHARFYFNHLPRLTTRPEHIKQLRQTILNLAVRGKLVAQDPNDEPAGELLKRIEREKQNLLKSREIKKIEEFEPIQDDELPFVIPSSWQFCRMGWLAQKLGAGSTPLGGQTIYQKEGVPFLRSQNVHNDGLHLDDVAFIPKKIHEKMSGTHIQKHDILLNITGASIGRCALVSDDFIEGNVSQHVAIVRLFFSEIRGFIHLSLISPSFQNLIDDVQVGISRAGLSMQRLKLFPMPIPPLAEQHRIVAKVDELMTLCDQLETQLTTTATDNRRLLEAILQEALAPALEKEDAA